MHSRQTPRTRPRCARLAQCTASSPLPVALSAVLLLALVHPAAPVLGLFLLCGWRLGRRPADRPPHRRGRDGDPSAATRRA
ncbi:hypothetical protein [Haloplanus pelagicus]|uniref:hypothetical protein n=1 Tax=Haloplanus pelagicus TaxID=2949995 RepID=UPI00203C0114|nr:hypothetical protein [Haloplanus sp. HW8-1]